MSLLQRLSGINGMDMCRKFNVECFEFFIRKDVHKVVVIESAVVSKEVSMLNHLLWCPGLCDIIIIPLVIC